MKTPIDFSCSCGRRLVAFVFEQAADRKSEVRFYRRTGDDDQRGLVHVTVCPNCDRDFSRVTVDEFLSTVWPSG